MRFRLVVDGEPHDIAIERTAEGLRGRVDGARYEARAKPGAGPIDVWIGSSRHRVQIEGTSVVLDGHPYDVRIQGLNESGAVGERAAAARGETFEVRPPMPGRVVRVLVSPGDRIRRGEPVVVLEAMKMQNEIPAPADALVQAVHVREGDSIPANRLIAVLEAT